ncbi:MAG: beta-propeller domain-containing protein [Oscillospiraceae bacterium]|nr:beta-propeller domain-containing protein [Oscillospiraceae bacterium]
MKFKIKKIMLVVLAAALIGSGVFAAVESAETKKADPAKGYIALYAQNPAAYIDGEKVPIDENQKAAPYLKNGLAYVPLRFAAEALGGDVGWNAEKNAATVNTEKGDFFEISANSELISANFKDKKSEIKEIKMEAKPELADGRMYIPAASMAEIFGRKYFYERGLIVIAAEKPDMDALISAFTEMTSVGSKENLLDLIGYDSNYGYGFFDDVDVIWDWDMPGEAVPAPATEAPAEAEKDASADYSVTNTQVQGVDEADIIKTDGQYIYYVRGGAIEIVRANSDGSFEYMSAFKLPSENYLEFKEIFIDGSRVIAIGMYKGKDGLYTQAVVINTENKKAPKLERTVEVKGEYATSRKIGGSVYFAATQYFYWWYYDWDSDVGIMPLYRDTAVSEEEICPGYDKLYCFPDFTESAITTLVGFNIDRPNEEAFVESILGLGANNIYMSQNALYIAEVKYNYTDGGNSWYDTLIYKFAADDGRLVFVKKGSAPGSVLNQFSMDEYQNYFRIATTKQDYGKNWTKYNGLYVFDGNMEIVGKIEDMAPGEQIYSVRFMGSRAYMVTFKQVDPLFAIDLSDPKNPAVLGALKIPGYSEYLHPYDENHLIGFGKDTVLDAYGNAYYTSMKLSLFDVSDMTNPVEMFVETIGDRGTDSELLRNHKALLFSKEKNLLAFPVTVYESKQKAVDGTIPAYGTFKFAGAYIYEIDLEKGFEQKGALSHLSAEDMLKSSDWGSDHNAYIQRLLTIRETLYAASNRKLSSHNLKTLGLTGELYFK